MYDPTTLKNYLLHTNYFLDNDYLVKYVNLITSNYSTNKVKFKTQKHHILPKKYFKLLNIEIDETDNNKVNLLYKDHILAHYYLCKCTISDLYNANVKAIVALVDNDFRKINEEWLNIHLSDFQTLYETQKEMVSAKSKNLSYFGHHHSEKTRLKMSEAKLGKPMSDEAKQKMRDNHCDFTKENNPAYGRHWYNNGKDRLYLRDTDTVPEGFIRGNLPKSLEETQRRKASLKGVNTWSKNSHWYNDGINEVMANSCPDGFIKGRLHRKRKTCP